METNGQPVKISELVEQARDRLASDDGTLLRSLTADWYNIRSFLIGGVRHGQQWPAGQIYVSRDAYELIVKLSVRTYGIEAVYRDSDALDICSRIEHDLDLNTVPWDINYQEKQRLENKRLRDSE